MRSLPKALEVLAASWRLRRFQSRGSTGTSRAGGGKLDVVYLWRDSREPGWLSARRAALDALSEEERRRCNLPDLRWVDAQRSGGRPDFLRWSLRSLARHFQELGRVYIVTDSPAPAWIEIGHPGLAWIPAWELTVPPCPEPSFSSQAIESFLYRLPGLSERFVYMNDDFFLTRPSDGRAFFQGDEILVRFGRGISPTGKPDPGEPGDTSAHKNSNRLLDESFVREKRLTVKHRPYALTRTLFAEAEARFAPAFAATRGDRFRSTRTFALHSCLVPYMALYTGKARAILPAPFAKDMIYWGNDLALNALAFRRVGGGNGGDFGFCVQGNAEGGFTPEAVAQFDTLMEGLYPEPAPFERCPER